MRHVALLLALAATASTPPLTLTNLKGPIARASGKAPARSSAELWAQILALPAAPAPTVAGQVPAIASGLDVAALLGEVGVPPGNAPDVVGAFRFLCGPGQTLPDDPLVYPGQPGRAHLHAFFGNLGADAGSTYSSLRQSGDSTCMNPLNRSAYWMPAMMSGPATAQRPDFYSLYYKSRPKTDPFCSTAAKACVGIPRGLRLIFGWDQFRPTEDQPENQAQFSFYCVEGWSPVAPASPTMVEPAKQCQVAGRKLQLSIQSPVCWNGRDLDSPDHRSHVVNMRRDASTGWQDHCPAGFDYIIPQLTLSAAWTILPGDDPTKWTLSSDHMRPGGAPGQTLHADYMEAWEDAVRDRWQAGCIDGFRNCSDGDLGDGHIMLRGRFYPAGVASPRTVSLLTY